MAERTAPLQARRYLERLRVPFEVWSLAGEAGEETWGKVVDVSSLTKFRRAVEKLSGIVDRQWLVWVDGIHLPQEIELAPEAVGIKLAR